MDVAVEPILYVWVRFDEVGQVACIGSPDIAGTVARLYGLEARCMVTDDRDGPSKGSYGLLQPGHRVVELSQDGLRL